MSSSFADLGVPAAAVLALRARGISSAFPIQASAIPPALEGRDVCGRAPTGSGKTIAFGVPLAVRAGRAKPGAPQALVLAPTRELAGQIEAEVALLMGPARRSRVASFYGGVGFGAQLNALRRGVDVAVACPGRLKDLIGRGALTLSEVSMVVIDEADRMADMGFLPEVKRLLDQVRPDRQTLLFSATLDGDVDQLVRRYQHDPVHVSVASEASESTATHHWMEARREDRVGVTADLIATHGSTVVFCRTKHGTDRLTKQLVAAGVKAVPIHGGRSQSQRERALQAFAAGRARALVATDVAARGIHVDGVGCVVHFDLPSTAKDYVHRSGRTGRAGADGVVVALVIPTDVAAAKALQKEVSRESAVGARPAQAASNQQADGRPRGDRRDRPARQDGSAPRARAVPRRRGRGRAA
ncbi:MAG: DEAD/DEAH box helicase [Actinomycetota bacterium]|nr:DEAD/DEAH box helicase [Actinomycetota bacterium]